MASLHAIINQSKEDLLRDTVEDAEIHKRPVEEYKCQLQGEQQDLIQQVLTFMTVSRDRELKKLLEAKPSSEVTLQDLQACGRS